MGAQQGFEWLDFAAAHQMDRRRNEDPGRRRRQSAQDLEVLRIRVVERERKGGETEKVGGVSVRGLTWTQRHTHNDTHTMTHTQAHTES